VASIWDFSKTETVRIFSRFLGHWITWLQLKLDKNSNAAEYLGREYYEMEGIDWRFYPG
jgi:hypothetical protein